MHLFMISFFRNVIIFCIINCLLYLIASIHVVDTLQAYSQRRLWAYGSNTFGTLGLNDSSTFISTPQLVRLPTLYENESIITIAVGQGDHVVIQTASGLLFGAGRNSWAQLGVGDRVDRREFSPVEQGNDVVTSVCVMKETTLYLNSEAELKSFGRNEYGQLGAGAGGKKDGSFPERLLPTTVFQSLTMKQHKPISVRCASQSAFVLTDKGLFGWGRNDYYQLGIGLQINQYVPVLILSDEVKDLYPGEHEIYALMKTGIIFAWGRGWSGQMGIGELVNQIAPRTIPFFLGKEIEYISAGPSYAIIQAKDKNSISKLYGFGSNSDGSLSLGSETDEVSEPQPSDISQLNGKRIIRIQALKNKSVITTEVGEVYWSGEILHFGESEFHGTITYHYSHFEDISFFPTNVTSFFGEKYSFFLESFSCGHHLDIDIAVCSSHGVCTTDNEYCACFPGYSNTFDLDFITSDKNLCQICPPGYYWNRTSEDSTTCIPCPIATYSNQSGATSESACHPCPHGFITTFPGSNSSDLCYSCDSGYYGLIDSENDTALCTACPPGTYSSSTSQLSIESCLPCPAGTFSSKEGASSLSDCIPCIPGTYSSAMGAIDNSTCVPCAAGSFSGLEGATTNETCTPCPFGFYVDIEGSKECVKCPSGTFTNMTGSSLIDECYECDPGTFITEEAQTINSTCLECPLGTYSNVSGSSRCHECPSGYYTNSTKSSDSNDCLPCPAGTYTTNRIECTPCPKGTYGTLEGQDSVNSCEKCPGGTWSDVVGVQNIDDCNKCPVGTASAVLGATMESTCQLCPIGTFSLVGSTACISCPQGSQVIVNEQNITTCIPCKAGQYISTNENGTTCPYCHIGTYTESDGQLMCTRCPSGMTTLEMGADSVSLCVPCEPGYYSLIISSNGTCEPCPIGTWSSTIGASDVSTCQKCPSGTYRDEPAGNSSSSCIKCPAGTFASDTGSPSIDSCQICPTETYSHEGASECTPCPPGTVTLEGGMQSEDDCLPCFTGTYSQVINNTAQCIPCREGTYSDTPLAVSEDVCIPCPPGKYNSIPGSDSSNACLSCPAGRFQPNYEATSFSDCERCPIGTYANSPASSSCTFCPEGYSTNADGKTSIGDCVKCEAGTYSVTSETNQTCSLCPIGTYSTDVGSSSFASCQPCPVGTYNNETGANNINLCQPCPLGTFSTVPGAASNDTCELCPVSTYADIPGSTSCKDCPFGTLPTNEGQTSINDCKPCPSGSYLNEIDGSSECELCPAGTYSTSEAAVDISSCIPCPKGTYSSEVGASDLSSCIHCPKGTFSETLGATNISTCEDCPPDTYSDTTGSIFCSNCPNGTMTCVGDSNWPDCVRSTRNEAITKCLECRDGSYYTNENGNFTCIRCPIGYYSSKTDASSLYCGYSGGPLAYGTENCNRESPHYNIGVESCIACGVGTYFKTPTSSNWLAQSKIVVCVACPASTSSNLTVAISESQCAQCPAATYAIQGSASCTPCPAGTFSIKSTGERVSASDCTTCPPGTFSDVQSTECTYCPRGTWSNLSGATTSSVCVSCIPGSYSDTLGAVSNATCLDCPPGTYAWDYSSSQCSDCAAGSANPYYGQTSCPLCSPGFYSYSKSLECLPCPPGTANAIEGATSIDYCLPCPEGTYAPNVNHTVCISCGEGYSCPYGASGRVATPAFSNYFARSVVDITKIVARTDQLTQSGEVVKYTLIPLFCLGFVLLLIVTTCCGCIRAGIRDPFKYFAIYDLLFNLYHPAAYGTPRIKKKNRLGGLFTLITLGSCFILFLLQTTDAFLNNIIISESFQMVEPKGADVAENIDITEGLYNVSISLFGTFASCTVDTSVSGHIVISSRGFISVKEARDDDLSVFCEQRERWRDLKTNEWHSIPNCYCEWYCSECILDGIEQSIDIFLPDAHTSSIFFELGVPHYLIDRDTGKRKQFKIDGNAIASSQNVFFGPKDSPVNLFFTIFHTKYIESPNFIKSIFQNAMPELTGVTSQLLSVTTTGAVSSNERMKTLRNEGSASGISIRYNLEVSKFVYISEEQLVQSAITYIAQLAALFGAIYSVMRVALNLIEITKKKIKKDFKRLKQRFKKQPDPLPDPHGVRSGDIQPVQDVHVEKTDPFKYLGWSFRHAVNEKERKTIPNVITEDFSDIYTTDDETLKSQNGLASIPTRIMKEVSKIQAWSGNKQDDSEVEEIQRKNTPELDQLDDTIPSSRTEEKIEEGTNNSVTSEPSTENGNNENSKID